MASNQKSKNRRFFILLILALISAVGGLFYHWAHGPDYEMTFEREVPSSSPPQTLGEALRWIPSWARWHHNGYRSELDNSLPVPYSLADQLATPGSPVRLYIEPREKKHRKFELELKILQFVPNEMIEVELIKDSKGKLAPLFSQIIWKIELIPGTPLGAPQGSLKGEHHPTSAGTLIRGSLRTRTQHWRSRLFGHFSRKILLNQLFYPNLIALAELKNPKSFVPPPALGPAMLPESSPD